jgi:hypothetical protein
MNMKSIASILAFAVTATLFCAASRAQSSWTTTTPLNESGGTSRLEAVAYNGYVYAAGGWNNFQAISTVQYAPINADGSLGAWQTTSALNTARFSFGLAAHGGYLYAAGGAGAGGQGISSVEYAQINADGSLGAWQMASTSLNYPRLSFGFATYGGYLYAVGGSSSRITPVPLEYAQIHKDGSLGAWTSVAFSQPMTMMRAVAHNGYLYTVGGSSCVNSPPDPCPNGGLIPSVSYAKINNDGSVGGWTTTSSLNTLRASFGLVVSGGTSSRWVGRV